MQSVVIIEAKHKIPVAEAALSQTPMVLLVIVVLTVTILPTILLVDT
jgi:hypothetical protein